MAIPFKVLLAELDAVAREKLTRGQQVEIVNAPQTRTIIKDLAKKFGVRDVLIRHVRYTYKHLKI